MQHIVIAYDLIVIMIGLAALSIALSWVLRTGEADVRNFCVLYALFTIAMLISVLMKYLSLNVAGYTAWTWYLLVGASMVFNGAVIVATIHFLLTAYRIQGRKPMMLVSTLTMVITYGLLFSPIGAVLDADRKIIHLGIGYDIADIWYVSAFTFAVVLGWGWLGRVWKMTDRRAFFVGLLIFASVGYLESLSNWLRFTRAPEISMSAQTGFLVSSVPYVLYGIFVIIYFLRYFVPAAVAVDQLFDAFLAKHKITGREREIILKVVQGKSNLDIAGDLFISVATVKAHLHNIYAKIGVDGRYDLLSRVRSGQ